MKLITEASAEKLRGGFYTPEPIAEFVLRWGINGSKDFDILEPSCGDGVFLEQLQKNKLKYKSFTEVSGRSHGGGVLELMPNEAERVLLPYHKDNASLLPKIDKLIRDKTSIEEVLKITNQVILKEYFGLTQKEIKLAHSIWKRLSSRRLNRGK